MIGKLLSTAVTLYLRSQVAEVEDLQVKIVGKSKQILQGYIPLVFIRCDRAIYQELHLSQVQLKGADIAVNLSEVIKQKPLRLLEAVFIEIQLGLDASDLQASLNSALLQSGLADLWGKILSAQVNVDFKELAQLTVEWQSIAIAQSQLNLKGIYQDACGETRTLILSTGLNLADAHTLCLSPLKIIRDGFAGNLESQLSIDLGTDVTLEELTVESEQIFCKGKIKINNS